MALTYTTGSFSADGFSAVINIQKGARLILKGPTFGGGVVHLCVADQGGIYYRTGRSWSAVAVENIDSQLVGGNFKLELAGASAPTVGWETAAFV